MYLESVCQSLNDSPWKGTICEVGVGVPFQSAYLNIPGASKTILFTHSPYNKAFQVQSIGGSRSVSVDATCALAYNDHVKISSAPKMQRDHLFSIAASGAHKSVKETGQSHGWVTLTFRELEDGPLKSSHFHWAAKKTDTTTRQSLGENLTYCIAWFINKILLGTYSSWDLALKDLPNLGINMVDSTFFIDVIKDSEITTQEHLQLVSVQNPLIYHNGSFHRATDYIRKYTRCYRGSFNPPTLAHESIGSGAMFEVSLDNARKGRATLDDMVHRIKMIDLIGRPVLITAGLPLFVELHKVLLEQGAQSMEYLIGADTFNSVVDEKYINVNDPDFFFDFEKASLLQSARFLVLERNGLALTENKYSNTICWRHLESNHPNVSATEVRGGKLEYVSDVIKEYIIENGLYGL